jgi:hypothetical protein
MDERGSAKFGILVKCGIWSGKKKVRVKMWGNVRDDAKFGIN